MTLPAGSLPDKVGSDQITPDRVSPDEMSPDHLAPDHLAPDQHSPESDDRGAEHEPSFPVAFFAVVGVSALVVIACVLGSAMSGLFDFGSGSNPAPAAPPSQALQAPATTMEDGQWIVGQDIRPGSYSVTVEEGSPGCSWERNASSDGTAASVLESGIGEPGDRITVGVRESDAIFQSRGCGVWERTSD